MFGHVTTIILMFIGTFKPVWSQCSYHNGSYSLTWSVSGNEITFNLRHQLPSDSWTGVAFGSSMSDLDFIEVSNPSNDRVTLTPKTVTGYSGESVQPKNGGFQVRITGPPPSYQNGVVTMQFARALGSTSPLTKAITLNGCQPWAFPASGGPINRRHTDNPVVRQICNLAQCTAPTNNNFGGPVSVDQLPGVIPANQLPGVTQFPPPNNNQFTPQPVAPNSFTPFNNLQTFNTPPPPNNNNFQTNTPFPSNNNFQTIPPFPNNNFQTNTPFNNFQTFSTPSPSNNNFQTFNTAPTNNFQTNPPFLNNNFQTFQPIVNPVTQRPFSQQQFTQFPPSNTPFNQFTTGFPTVRPVGQQTALQRVVNTCIYGR